MLPHKSCRVTSIYHQSCPKALPTILLETNAIARLVPHTVPSLCRYPFLHCSLWPANKTPQAWTVPSAWDFQANVNCILRVIYEKHCVSSEERIIPVVWGWEKAPVLIHVTLVSIRSNSIKAKGIIRVKSWRCSVVPHLVSVTVYNPKWLRKCSMCQAKHRRCFGA